MDYGNGVSGVVKFLELMREKFEKSFILDEGKRTWRAQMVARIHHAIVELKRGNHEPARQVLRERIAVFEGNTPAAVGFLQDLMAKLSPQIKQSQKAA